MPTQAVTQLVTVEVDKCLLLTADDGYLDEPQCNSMHNICVFCDHYGVLYKACIDLANQIKCEVELSLKQPSETEEP